MKFLLAWVGAGVVGVNVVTALVGSCMLVPVLGWFIGVPIVLVGACMCACLWVSVLPFVLIMAATDSVMQKS